MTGRHDEKRETAQVLRDWARGDLTLEAAIELLARAMGGRLLQGPWIRRDERGQLYFCTRSAVIDSGYLSGGERRLLAIAASLATSSRPVDLGDVVTGIDHESLLLVLDALAHAGGLTGRWKTSDTGGDTDIGGGHR